MNNATFGELTFGVGWKTQIGVTLFGSKHDVVVKAKAYFEKDGVTALQETAFSHFKGNLSVQLKTIEKLLNDYANGNAASRFVPRTMLFNRDGSYAMLLDDKRDEDGGVAVTLAPQATVVAQDEYL